MRRTFRPWIVLACFVGLSAFGLSSKGARIEAVRGKHYKLTKRHGPWMIMVASFNKPTEDRRTDGMSPDEAADELVYELRLHGIPAYTFRQEEILGKVTTVSRRTQTERAAKIREWNAGICVLAGNYFTSDEKLAQNTLKQIKSFEPKFLSEVAAEGTVGPEEKIKRSKSGGVFHTTHSHPGPLSGAFMTTNPLLSDEELALRSHDPLILQLNSGSEYSLFQNHGKYTVVVATFQGRSHTVLAQDANKKQFDIGAKALSGAAERAWELCNCLRQAKAYGYDEDFEAYVYHDHYSSIVTVGSFKSRNDPRITEIQNKFGAKVASIKSDGSPLLGAEIFAVPKTPVAAKPTTKSWSFVPLLSASRSAPGKDVAKSWIFDPFPQVIDVPR